MYGGERVAPNLYQRLAAITGDIKPPDATHTHQQGWKYISIQQIENVLRPLLHKHGVVIIPDMVEEGGEERAAWVSMAFDLVNTDDPADHRVVVWREMGQNRRTAVSFATKYFLKRLFHVEDEEDPDGTENQAPATQARSRASSSRSTTPARSKAIEPQDTGRGCPSCGEGNLIRRTNEKGPWIGCSRFPDCRYRAGVEDSPAPVATPREAPPPPPPPPDDADAPVDEASEAASGPFQTASAPLYERALNAVKSLPSGMPRKLAEELNTGPLSPKSMRSLDDGMLEFIAQRVKGIHDAIEKGFDPFAVEPEAVGAVAKGTDFMEPPF